MRQFQLVLKSDDFDFWTDDSISVGPRSIRHGGDQNVGEFGGEESSSSNPSSGTAVAGGKKGLDEFKMGWPMGLEPTTNRTTICCSTN